MSREEREHMAKEIEYMTKGPGRLEKILDDEMSKLYTHMDDKIKKQDEEYIAKLPPGKK